MSYGKVKELIRLLNRRTGDNSARWERTENDRVFQISFSDYSVRLFDTDDGYSLVIFDNVGDVVEAVADTDLREEMPNAFAIMGALFSKVRRQAMGVDVALDSIIGELSREDDMEEYDPVDRDNPF